MHTNFWKKGLYLLVCLSLLLTSMPPATAVAYTSQGAAPIDRPGDAARDRKARPDSPVRAWEGASDRPGVPAPVQALLAAGDTTTNTLYLPVVMVVPSEDTPTPPPPVGTEVLVKPGIGGIAAATDGSVRAAFSARSVQRDTWVRYQAIERPTIITPNLAVGGPAFSLTAWEDADGTPVTEFPHDVTIIPPAGDNPAYSVITPSITISVSYTYTDVWGLDLRTLSLYTRKDASQEWERVPTAVYQDRNLLVAEIDHLSEFVPMGALSISAQDANKRLALDPDDDVGHATWPGTGTVREITYNMQLARQVQQRLVDDGCRVDILLTRDSESETFVSRSLRAQKALNFGADTFTTLAFNALLGIPWGTSSDGGVRGWARSGHSDDDALVNEFFNRIQEYTGRPHTQGINHPSLYGEFNALPDSTAYGHIEVLFMDHNFDWPVINTGFSSITDAAYAALRTRLEAAGMICGDPDNPPPLPAPPSAEQLKRWRDLGYQNLQAYGSQYDLIFRRQNYQIYGADPVSFSTGNHVVQARLFGIPARGGLDFDFTLTYNSQDGRDDLFGYGWSFPYNARAQRYSDESVSVVLHDGRTYHYTWDGGGYNAPAGVYDTLQRTADGWQWTTPNGTALTFKEAVGGLGIMTEWRDRQGNALHFAYDLSGQENWKDGNPVPRPPLTEINDGAGRTVTLNYTDGHVTRIDDFGGRAFSFGYADGNLTSITDADGGTRRFQYDARHRLTHEWDAENFLYLQNTYDDRDRVIEQVDASGTHSYLAHDPISRVTTFTDNLGNVNKYYYDEQNRVTAEEDAQGNAKRYEYDANYNLLKETDARGAETAYTYDGKGNVTSRTDPLDGYSSYTQDATGYEYNADNDLVKLTDALGNVTTYDYDGSGNLVAIHEPGGRDTQITYNSWGQPLGYTDAEGRVTSYEYDGYGNLVKTTDAEGNVSTSAYDQAGRETSYTDANGHTVYFVYDGNDNITRITDPKGTDTDFAYDANNLLKQSADRRGGVTKYEYDENLKLTAETDPENYRVEYTYDAMYNRTARKDARGNTTRYTYDALYRLKTVADPKSHTTTYEYDANGNLTAAIDAQGHRTTMVYDAVNRLKFLTDALGNRTEYCYDVLDRLVRTIGPRGEVRDYHYDEVSNLVKTVDPLGKVSLFQYDGVGNLRFTTDANGHTTESVYDKINRLTGRVDPLGHEAQTEYDGVGNVTRLVDARGNPTRFEYDENDNLVKMTDSLGGEATFAYDAEDNRTGITDQQGNTTGYSYDLRGLAVKVTEPGSVETEYTYDGNGNLERLKNAKGQETAYEYDDADLLVRATDPLGNQAAYAYDGLDRLTSRTDAEGNGTLYGYDALGRLTGVTDAMTGTTRYGYDEVGNLTVITDANGSVTRFEYNFLNQLTQETNPLTRTWRYSYDDAGNLIRRVDGNWQPTHYAYDAADRLAEVSYPDGRKVTHTYDENGNELTMADWNGTIAHQYDALNRRTQTTNFDGAALSYGYDAASNLTGLTYPDGQTAHYSYDARNLLSRLQDPAGRMTVYERDPLGALTKITRPNGTSTEYTYDGANRLTTLAHEKGAETFSAFAYALDKVGNRKQIAELRTFPGSGTPVPVSTVKDYDYDAIYRLTGARTDRGQDVSYAYDPVGNRTEQSGVPQAVDPADGLQPVRPAPPITNTYGYNAANQMVAIGGQQSATSLEYDGNGNRVRETETLTDGTALLTTYSYDYENRVVGVAKTLSDTTAITVTMVATYTYDGYGRRVAKDVAYPGGITPTQVITYLYDNLDVAADYESVGSVTTATYYYWAGGGIAEVERLPNAANGFAGDVHWTHTDGLGSLVDLTDLAGDTATQAYYDEYGQLLTAPESLGRYSYTGQEYDPETGLYHFYARYYDPERGVWLTQDELRGYNDIPSTLHRYKYVLDNPLIYADPDGRIPPLIVAGAIAVGAGVLIGVGSRYVEDVVENVTEGKAGWDIMKPTSSKEEYAASAVGGAVQGGLSLIPVVGPYLGGAGGAAVESYLEDKWTGKPISWEKVGKDAVIGALTAGIGRKITKTIFPKEVVGRLPQKLLTQLFGKHAQRVYKELLIDFGTEITVKLLREVLAERIISPWLSTKFKDIVGKLKDTVNYSGPSKRKLIDTPPSGYAPYCSSGGCFA